MKKETMQLLFSQKTFKFIDSHIEESSRLGRVASYLLEVQQKYTPYRPMIKQTIL